MKSILALLVFAVSLPFFGSKAPDDTSPAADQLPCAGCFPTLQFSTPQEPPAPCLPARDAFASIKFINVQRDHGGGFCGDCRPPHQNACSVPDGAQCTIHATIELRLKPGSSFHPTQTVTVVTLPVNVTTGCNTGFQAPPIKVYAAGCSFTANINYICSKCSCPQIT